MDTEGEVIARTGYRPGGPEKYVGHLGKFIEVYGELTRLKLDLATAKELDRAKLLDQIIESYDKLGNDADEIAGWKATYHNVDRTTRRD